MTPPRAPKRVVVAGLGDSGLLTAIHLSRYAEVVGISAKPSLLSGQELGIRLTRPEDWIRDYWISFDRYRRLDRVRTVHGTLVGLDLARRTVEVQGADGDRSTEPYDVLVISTGVANGFWRRGVLETDEEIEDGLRRTHHRLAAAASVAVIGGGAAAISCAANLASTWPEKQVDLYFPGERALPQHHPRVWRTIEKKLGALGVSLHPGHRAVVPEGFGCDEITADPVDWSTGQESAAADAVLWAIGRVRPHTDWLPDDLLDEHGFVRVGADLQVPGHPGLFAVGDVAATDPLRTSARNRADKLLACNIRAYLAGRPLGDYQPPRGRWGSVLGEQANGLEVFAPSGQAFRFPAWSIRTVLQPWIVRRGIYKGVRRSRSV